MRIVAFVRCCLNANTFTLLTVVLSGIISWIISAIYFYIGNRNDLKSSLLHPMKKQLAEPYSRDKYRILEEIYRGFNAYCKEYYYTNADITFFDDLTAIAENLMTVKKDKNEAEAKALNRRYLADFLYNNLYSIYLSKKKRFNYIMSKIEESKTPETNTEGS